MSHIFMTRFLNIPRIIFEEILLLKGPYHLLSFIRIVKLVVKYFTLK